MNTYWLIDRVLSGKATPDEKEELEKWMAADPRNKEEYEDMKLLWEFSKDTSDKRKTDPHFYEGLYKIRDIIELRKRSGKNDWKVYLAILALIFSLVALVYCCISYQSKESRGGQAITIQQRCLDEVFVIVQKRYNVSIAVDNPSVMKCRFTGTFNSRARLEEVMDVIRKSTGLDYHITDRSHITIKGQCR
ncbi:MAG: DUF4974 domain-containing protein [Cyclobacteriaceae bacterium]|nr:DUF4974 domain-containing protein [Cyclobacteriaceae bacterium]